MPLHGWGNHPGESGHGLTIILTFTGCFEYNQYQNNENNTVATYMA